MKNNALSIIIAREYLERVKRKSFIISTLLVPLFMVILMVAPAAMMLLSEPETTNIAVIDDTGRVLPRITGDDKVNFIAVGQPLDSLRFHEGYQAILVIENGAIANPSQRIRMYSHGTLSMMTNEHINTVVSRAVEDLRLQAYDIGNLRQILNEVEVDMTIPVIDIDKEEESAISSELSYFLALLMDMMLYMFILIYGQMVMTSIIEEKANRVLELVVSSVRPATLMMGKIFGVGLVAITQILIWAILLGACSAWVVPMMSGLANSESTELAGIIGQLSDTGYIVSLFVYMLLFFIGGYLFYSAIFAAIGSAVDNIQDASQLTSVATIPVIVGIVASMSAINAPGSSLAFWLSIIPFTSPMTMMARLPFGVPLWQTALSIVVLYASFMLLIWLCAKIYRVGIFMYGKKPNLAELIRWAKMK